MHRQTIIKTYYIMMSKYFEETPILFGEDAKRFRERMDNVKPASPERIARIKMAYEEFKKIATFQI